MASIGVTEYTVYPTGYDETDVPPSDKHYWVVTVKDRGKGWSVGWMGDVLSVDGEWDWEPQPSSRDDAFFARFRFTEEEAKARALAIVDTIAVNGRTFADAVQRAKESARPPAYKTEKSNHFHEPRGGFPGGGQ